MMKTNINNKIHSTFKEVIAHRSAYVLMAPFLILFFIFTIWPILISILYSLTNFNAFQPPEFTGLSNYYKLFFSDELFFTALKNTLVFAILTGPLSFLLCLFFAWLVNELSDKLRAFMTLILYAPSISSNLFLIWLLIYSGDRYGYLNSFLIRLGIVNDPVQWLYDPKYMMIVVIIVQLWLSFGTSFLTLRAGFTTIDKQYYEAASIDGMKNRWQELWFITLPMMAPHLLLSAVLSIAGSFSSINVAVALTGSPSTNYATYMIMHFVQDYGMIRLERGYASAAAVILFMMSLFTNLKAQSIIRKVGR